MPRDIAVFDAYVPAIEALQSALDAGSDLAAATAAAADAAQEGMKSTVPMQARKGRASYLGPRSVGHQDPGATSTWLIFRCLGEAVAAGT